MWPTPRVSDGNGSKIQPGKQGGLGLNQKVVNYPTPAAHDYRSGKGRKDNGHTPQLPERVGGKLNADWTEWLMNFPIGWTARAPLDATALEWFEGCFAEGIIGLWWQYDPADLEVMTRTVTEQPDRVQRLKGLGNAQVPYCMAIAWLLLSEDEMFSTQTQPEEIEK